MIKKHIYIIITISLLLTTGCVNSHNIKTTHIESHGKWESFYRDINCSNLTVDSNFIDNVKDSFSASFEFGKWYILGNQNSLEEMKRYLKRFVWLPVGMECKLGDIMHSKRKDIVPQKAIYKRKYKIAKKYLHDILAEVPKDTPYKFQIYLVRGNTKDLFSYPGGKIYVTKRALNDRNFMKFALAHEISHVLKRHYVRQYQNIILDLIDNKDDLMQIIRSIRADNRGNKKVNKIFLKIAQVYTTRDALWKIMTTSNKNQELEADSCAVRLLAHDPNLQVIIQKAIHTFESRKKIERKNRSFRRIFDLNFNTHPSSEERKQNIIYIYSVVKKK